MPVGIDNINLRITGGGPGFDFHLTEIAIARFLPIALAAQEFERAFVTLHTHCKMNIASVDSFPRSAESSVIMHDEMQMLSIADLEPGTREWERRPGDFFQAQDLAIELL